MSESALHEKYMQRCLQLAIKAEGLTYPNPMVGSVIVHNNKIIGEGFHAKAGQPHAEVVAINSVKDKSLLKESTLYVNLEPCAHYGKTPPCALLIQQMKIPKVVIGCIDTFSQVAGKGIQMLQNSGVDVKTGILEQESRKINRRFFTFHEHKRPFIILKWAQSYDGFIDIDRQIITGNRPTWITNEYARRVVHLWRSREQSILVGSITSLKDNPELTVRQWSGNNPLRLVIDRANILPNNLAVFNEQAKTVLFTSNFNNDNKNVEMVKISDDHAPVISILDELYKRNIQSLIVEGGATLLKAFIELNLWDEARIFTGKVWFNNGVKAPTFSKSQPSQIEDFGNSTLIVYSNYS